MLDLIDIFQQLVTIDSPSGEETNMAEYLAYYLKECTDVVKRDKYGNIYACLEGKDSPLFFTAHLDTVEPGRSIKPQIKNEYITSDGTTILGADNKSSIACMLQAIKRLQNESHRTLELVFTREEETTTAGAINFDYSLLRAKEGYCFDSVSPVGTIIMASPFYERFDLKIFGKAAHASKPQEAINVLSIFTDILNEFPLGKLDDDTVINIGQIYGGHVRNTIPGELILNGEIRGFIENIMNEHKKRFTGVIRNVCNKYKATYDIEFVRENPGYKFQPIDTFIEHTKKIMNRCKIEPCSFEAWGVSDANIFNNRDLTCLNLGDGVEYPHTVAERIKISDMEKLVDLMVQLARI